ncbi:winged helix DNA-binding domain-containing protein [Streptomyces lavendulocolor]|uniref:winged helix DNA-binding domain-containing protein n=1 Tax=Streptomyces lavendulocolor TaxID=67316 RepID=UPI003C2DDA25
MTNVLTVQWPRAAARRLERHGLVAPAKDAGPADAVAAMCGAHAQLMSAAELSVALRLEGTTRTGVREALWTAHTLVKTYGPRGTVHVLPARDLAMWTGALSALPGVRNLHAPGVRLTPEQTDQVVEAVGDALSEGELTVEELGEAVTDRAGAWAGDLVVPAFGGMWPRWRQAMDVAANRGALCFGPQRGRKVTYTNPRRLVPGFRPLDGPAALTALVEAYLRSYGPATAQHFAQWTATPRPWATELFTSLEAEGRIEPVEFTGQRAWLVTGDTTMPSTPPGGVRLLPYFDAFTVGCHPREALFPGRAAQRALSGGQAGNFPVLLVDGEVAGVWHQRRSGRKILLTVEPLDPLTPGQLRELDEQVERVGHILEGRPELTIGTVTVGAHA